MPTSAGDAGAGAGTASPLLPSGVLGCGSGGIAVPLGAGAGACEGAGRGGAGGAGAGCGVAVTGGAVADGWRPG